MFGQLLELNDIWNDEYKYEISCNLKFFNYFYDNPRVSLII